MGNGKRQKCGLEKGIRWYRWRIESGDERKKKESRSSTKESIEKSQQSRTNKKGQKKTENEKKVSVYKLNYIQRMEQNKMMTEEENDKDPIKEEKVEVCVIM